MNPDYENKSKLDRYESLIADLQAQARDARKAGNTKAYRRILSQVSTMKALKSKIGIDSK